MTASLFEADVKSKARACFEVPVSVADREARILVAFEEEDRSMDYARRTRRGIQAFEEGPKTGCGISGIHTGMNAREPIVVKEGKLALEYQNLTLSSTKIAVFLQK